jgi:hypothetical protein
MQQCRRKVQEGKDWVKRTQTSTGGRKLGFSTGLTVERAVNETVLNLNSVQ